MGGVKHGDKVRIHYTGKLENGKVVDSSKSSEPLEFTIGSGHVLEGLESVVIGMEIGEIRTVEVPTEEAFGPRRKELVVKVRWSDFPDDVTPSLGMPLKVHSRDGERMDAVISHLDDQSVTVDANHPLAGIALTFDVELVAVVEGYPNATGVH